MGFKMVIVPPNTQPDWPQKIRAAVPDCEVQMFESAEAAMDAIVDADAAYGNIPPALLRRARKLRWIQAPAAAPPAGYYYKELIESNVVVTNQREIYNDHIGTHIMAFILAFARGLHRYIPHQLQRQWRPNGVEPIIHLPETTALIIGVGGIFSAQDAWEKITAGATLLQIYTVLVYEGPAVVKEIIGGIIAQLEEHGFKRLEEAVGTQAS